MDGRPLRRFPLTLAENCLLRCGSSCGSGSGSAICTAVGVVELARFWFASQIVSQWRWISRRASIDASVEMDEFDSTSHFHRGPWSI